MASNRELKHVVLMKYNEGVTKEQIEECIKKFGILVDLIPTVKTFKWGKDMGIADFHQGFTHIFELTFESVEEVRAFSANKLHEDYAKLLMPLVEKYLLFDFVPENVKT